MARSRIYARDGIYSKWDFLLTTGYTVILALVIYFGINYISHTVTLLSTILISALIIGTIGALIIGNNKTKRILFECELYSNIALGFLFIFLGEMIFGKFDLDATNAIIIFGLIFVYAILLVIKSKNDN